MIKMSTTTNSLDYQIKSILSGIQTTLNTLLREINNSIKNGFAHLIKAILRPKVYENEITGGSRTFSAATQTLFSTIGQFLNNATQNVGTTASLSPLSQRQAAAATAAGRSRVQTSSGMEVHFKWFRDSIANTFNKIKTNVKDLTGTALQSAFAIGPLNAILSGFMEHLDPLNEMFTTIGSSLGTLLIPLVNQIIQFLTPFIPQLIQIGMIIGQALLPLVAQILNAISPFMPLILGLIEILAPLLTLYLQFSSPLAILATVILPMLVAAFPGLTGFLTQITTFIKDFLGGVGGALMAFVVNIPNALGAAINFVVTFIAGLGDASSILKFFGDTIAGIVKWFGDLGVFFQDMFKDGIAKGLENLIGWIGSQIAKFGELVWNMLVNFFTGKPAPNQTSTPTTTGGTF